MAKPRSRVFGRQLTFIDHEKSIALDGEQDFNDDGHGTAFSDLNGQFDELAHCLDEKEVAIVIGMDTGLTGPLVSLLRRKGYRVALLCDRVDSEDHVLDLDESRTLTADLSSYSEQVTVFSNVWSVWRRLDVLCVGAGVLDADSDLYFHYLEQSSESFHQRGSAEQIPPVPDPSCTSADQKTAQYAMQLATHFMRYNLPLTGGRVIVHVHVREVRRRSLAAVQANIVDNLKMVAPPLMQTADILINAVISTVGSTSTGIEDKREFISQEDVTSILDSHEQLLDDAIGIFGQALLPS